jgi:drug/metabolite transporter (DMT)-like permease
MLLVLMASSFAGNHVAARIAFDNDTGLLLAILCRSGVAMVVLIGLVLWQRQPLGLPAGAWRWQLVLGLLIATQSICLYTAVARIPVALALLINNTFPIMLALLTWLLGGAAPTRSTVGLMGFILIGLVLALDIPARLSATESAGPEWVIGIAAAFIAALVFAIALWITDRKLSALRGSVRSMLTLMIVFSSMAIAGSADLVPGGMSTPANSTGWIALATLVTLYGAAFTLLFVTVPRLNMAQNAPVMNVEPIVSLFLGWLLLDQLLSGMQLAGGAVVLAGIIILTTRREA